MSNQGFTNTFILEANRLSSIEVNSGNITNNAVFTNKVNDGLRLNTGDVVSVHSAYISELGAEGSDIQIKGVELDRKNASQILSYNVINNDKFDGSPANSASLVEFNSLVNGFPLTRRVDVNESIYYRDDEINMVMSPYKNANGEYYITLPYRYGQEYTNDAGHQIDMWNIPNPIIGLDQSWTGSASRTFGNASHGNLTRKPNGKQYSLADVRVYVPEPTTTSLGVGFKNASSNIAVRHDNARFTLFQLRNCIHLYPLNNYLDDTTQDPEYVSLRDNCLKAIPWNPDDSSSYISNASYQYGLTYDDHYGNPYWRDIATREYVRVRNKVNCSVSGGYNSNIDIASKITEDMLRTESIKTQNFQGVEITTYAENQVNKLYTCATQGIYDVFNCDGFNEITNASGDSEIFHYIEAHDTIGVKRPDLYELGRGMSASSHGYEIRFDYYLNNSNLNASGLIYTSIPWEKVGDMKKLVDAQHTYPELFDTEYMSEYLSLYNTQYLLPHSPVGRSGFLHINQHKDHKFLGYDLTDNKSSYWATYIAELVGGACPNASLCSIPFFFDINASTSNEPEGIIATGHDWESAVYGFAVKTYDALNKKYYIGLKSSAHYNIGYTSGGNPYYPADTRIGWDYHFNAYGCPCILLWNGMNGVRGFAYNGMGESRYVNEDDDGGIVEVKTLSDKIQKVYVGSPNVAIEFDEASDRFQILRLHQSERIGNIYDAGYTADDVYTDTDASGTIVFTNPDGAVPENDNAESFVYKLNKQPSKTNYSPCITPYRSENNASFFTRYTTTNNACYTAKQPFVYINNNFVKGTIYDSTCGNFIVDWGINEKYWNDSLWGIMGFRYSQTSGSGNTQTRVIDSVRWGDSIDGMDLNTTNADVSNADFEELNRNMFNIKVYGLTPPITQLPRFEVFTGNACHTYSPPVNITQVKGQPLRALEIPTRTLRPYYTIRSNIVGQARYYGSKQSSIPLNVVAIVEKVSQSGDFFNLTGSQLQFTITQPFTLTDIRTEICDPDGSYSRVSPNSAVLYKIDRQVNADMNVVSTILQNEPKKQALAFEESLDNPQPTKKDINDVINQMVVPQI